MTEHTASNRPIQSGATAAPEVESDAALLVHGGAWDIPDEALPDHREGLRQAVARGRALLEKGAPALEAACEAVAALEAHGAFDAGCGAMLNQDGEAELDAGCMDGSTLGYGAVMGVRRVRQPIRVARRLVERGRGQVRLLCAEGAERFAEAEGFALVENEALICGREWARYEKLRREAEAFHPSEAFLPGRAWEAGGPLGDTVGRVGDSPLPGAGFYANAGGAASATGWGEAIAAVLLAGRAVDRLAAGHAPLHAATSGLAAMRAEVRDPHGQGATGGLLVMDRHGRGAWAFTTPRMARAGWHAGADVWVAV